MEVNQEEMLEWLQHPVTMKFRRYLTGLTEEIKNDWASGLFTAESAEGTCQKNSVALGQIRLLEDLLNISEVELK